MADNAPNAVIPGGNVVQGFHKKVTMHVATITGADGSATVNQSRSTAGITVTYVSEGRYTLGFPTAPTGSIGWAVICPPQTAAATKADVRMYSILSGTVNYATGVLTFVAFDASDTAIVSDIIGDVTVLIYQLSA